MGFAGILVGSAGVLLKKEGHSILRGKGKK